MSENLTEGYTDWENAVHEDDHYWCSSTLHLGAFLFSILINNVGTKSRRALTGVFDDIREVQSAHVKAKFYKGVLLLDELF